MSGKINQGMIEAGVSKILSGLGVDLTDHNYLETPKRVAKFYEELYGEKKISWSTFPEEYSEFILLKGHRMFSLCCHHLLPVEFTVNLAYIPNGHVLGLSKLARIFDECNNGPLLQERFTKDVLARLTELCPDVLGCACLIQGEHGCTKVRGIKSEGQFLTYRMQGCFKEEAVLEERFFRLCGV